MPRQLEGPYHVGVLGDGRELNTLYPPSALLLFVPAAYVPVLWWAVPVTIIGVVLWRLRPSAVGVVVMLGLLAWPRAIGAFLFGNTDMWVAAGVAAGLVWGWPALLVLLKPTFAPLALIGVRHRSWWVGAALAFVFVVLSLPMWMDCFLTTLRNMRGLDITYSLGSLPLVLIPVVAWLSRSRSART